MTDSSAIPLSYSPIPQSPYQFDDLQTETSFRVLELLPGPQDAPISCMLHAADWKQPPDYEAVSYAWGDRTLTAVIRCHGKRLEVGQNLHSGLTHLRLAQSSRFLWVDCLCMHQTNTEERNQQVRQMRRIYQKAKAVIIWLGPDNLQSMARTAVSSIRAISDFLCERLDISITNLSSRSNVYQEVLYHNRHTLPKPDRCDLTVEISWDALRWFYCQSYFTRLWVIQEINASSNRLVHCGHEQIEWDRVDLVAGYMIMDTAFASSFEFAKTHCWWTATVTSERMRNPKNWLWMLYLASNFSCLDERDMIYGLFGLMNLEPDSKASKLLTPDYKKSLVEVFRDSVEAAFDQFENTDVLLYLAGNEFPSWIPRWNRPMLFRNPFRFGKPLPWKPTGNSKPEYHIDEHNDILHISGHYIDTIESAATYNERYFSNDMLNSPSGIQELRPIWLNILDTLASAQPSPPPLSASLLSAAALAFSFGVDADASPASSETQKDTLLHNFIAYLKLILEPATFDTYIPGQLSAIALSDGADGHAFGKPVWSFPYPDSGVFVSTLGRVGCSVCVPEKGDKVVALNGGKYCSILRSFEVQPGNDEGERREKDVMRGSGKNNGVDTAQEETRREQNGSEVHGNIEEKRPEIGRKAGDDSDAAGSPRPPPTIVGSTSRPPLRGTPRTAYLIKGYTYVHGVMMGEHLSAEEEGRWFEIW